jgi:exopolysaccharide production protein ExoZ
MNNNRLHYLDYLRGFSALGIMFYHYLAWTLGSFNASNPIGRVGIYGVSIFYILSGLTLYHVYFNLEVNKINIINFIIKRIFRIVPLFALITILTILTLNQSVPIKNLILNITCLFGFINPAGYYTNGGWSIGNEMVFYLFFILYFIAYYKSKIVFYLMSIFTFFIYFYFSTSILTINNTLDSQWTNYVNPFNQLFLFLIGILIGIISNSIKNKINQFHFVLTIIIGVLIFIFYPTNFNDRIILVTNWSRLIFTLSCSLICFGLYNLNYKLPNYIHKPGVFFAEISYCLYLVHGICFTYSKFILDKILINYSQVYRFGLSIMLTIIFSYFSYMTLEKFFIKKGKNLTQKLYE